VKYEMLRRVERDKESVVKASAVFGLSRPSFYNAMRAFRSEGMEGLAARPPGPRGPHKLNEEVMALVERTVMENDGISFLDVAALIKEVFGASVHPRSIERALRRKKKRDERPNGGTGPVQSG
jgi:transposase